MSPFSPPALAEEALIQTYRDTIRPLYAYVSRRVGGDLGLAEDLVQDTWMRALDAWPSQGVPREPLAWLTRVAHNALVSHFRRFRPEPVDPALLDLEDNRFSPASPDIATAVSWGLTRLRPVYAALLEAFYFEEKTVAEIASAHGLSERAVEGRLRRARTKLAKTLKPVLRPPAATLRAAAAVETEHARRTRTP